MSISTNRFRRTCCSLGIALLAAWCFQTAPVHAAEPAATDDDSAATAVLKQLEEKFPRVEIPVAAADFHEGWKLSLPVPKGSGDSYEFSVKDGWLRARRQTEARKLDWYITVAEAVDSGKTAEHFAIGEWPTYFLLDKAGKIELGYSSRFPSDEQIEELLNRE